jgi:transcriptional regulator with PAS, ATPase and Fis domain
MQLLDRRLEVSGIFFAVLRSGGHPVVFQGAELRRAELLQSGLIQRAPAASGSATAFGIPNPRLPETPSGRAKGGAGLSARAGSRTRLGRIIGRSAAMQPVYDLIEKAAAADVNVIIYGESGTGKELVAHAIHDLSDRKTGSFVPVNCGAIPETLMESEFFGHRKGAFTGAVIDKHGFLDLAKGGTLFLDELGEIGHGIQVKLLRAIDGGGYMPIGGLQLRLPDVRIIAATNRDVAAQLRSGAIREDFFYRIHVIPIYLPPLRARREDIPPLIDHFVEKFGKGKRPQQLSPQVVEALTAHDWPGNVRELQNTVYRYLTLNTLDFAGVALPPAAETQTCRAPSMKTTDGGLDARVQQFEKELILQTLERHRWQREVTAEALGIHRKTLFTKMKKYELI